MAAEAKGEKILKELGFDFQTFTIENFIHFVSEAKKREIITIPWDTPAALFGAWMSDGEEPKEYILFRRNAPLIHQIHIQLHEISHFLLGHPTLKITRKLIAEVVSNRASFPFEEVARLRSTEKDELEEEAETLADLIQKRVIQHSQLEQLTRSSPEEKLSDFLRTLGINS